MRAFAIYLSKFFVSIIILNDITQTNHWPIYHINMIYCCLKKISQNWLWYKLLLENRIPFRGFKQWICYVYDFLHSKSHLGWHDCAFFLYNVRFLLFIKWTLGRIILQNRITFWTIILFELKRTNFWVLFHFINQELEITADNTTRIASNEVNYAIKKSDSAKYYWLILLVIENNTQIWIIPYKMSFNW